MDNDLDMHDRSTCYLCGADLATAHRRDVLSREPLTQGVDFEIAICPGCGLGQTSPYPAENSLGVLYEGPKDRSSVTLESRDFDPIKGTWIDRAKDWTGARSIKSRVLRKLKDPPKSIVDFGAGNGRFAALAKELVPSATVIAVDYQDARPAALPQDIPYITVDNFADEQIQADVIWLRHVLEHSSDPVALLSSLAAQLSPVGQIYIEVPNLNSTLARLAGRHWIGYYVPRHIFHFTAESLTATLWKAGLEGAVGSCELPIMGNQLQEWLGVKKYGPLLQIAGAALHPVQLIAEMIGRSSGCLMVLAKPKT